MDRKPEPRDHRERRYGQWRGGAAMLGSFASLGVQLSIADFGTVPHRSATYTGFP